MHFLSCSPRGRWPAGVAGWPSSFPAINSTTSALMALPSLERPCAASGRCSSSLRLWSRHTPCGVMYRFSHAMIGTCVVVIATSDGELWGALPARRRRETG